MNTQLNLNINNILFTFKSFICLSILVMLASCEKEGIEINPSPINNVYKIPVVIHVIHNGEIVGEGTNLSVERIERQIEILNEDFRRKEGTRGYNNNPNGGDSKIEFVLAKQDPEGNPINGINRINKSIVNVTDLGYNQNHYAQYAYWNTSNYINIWTTPLPESTECLVLGSSTGPETNLPGTQLLLLPQDGDADGVLINSIHFGESDIACHARFGRTLTHEMGHYLGVLHPWAGNDCEFNDYCDDTPAVDKPVYNIAFVGCEGELVAVNNYMSWSDDELMNMFSKDQIARMHYVLKHHQGRHALLSSSAL
ncbi:Pregnancy-associated plasma protein-A [Flaviramulus basaltis]|uniref:Pregnancy-associated plasma protein-A n=1 Tax=Flaviramulus basaltis TaxID=369401 RepID=A0A1K2IK47_9FLAO|nr:M43 family zinc metalloprotease [Flaviramulus basaltis]SFZ92825.1 Pregnancy-associated plasma protein-A [Flaviramulus basaltis]